MTPPSDTLYAPLAAAFARASLGCERASDAEAIERARAEGLKLHRFKRSSLPRVRSVLGVLRGLAPASLLDVGSGRGAFLWPLLDAFPALPVTSLDEDAKWTTDVARVTAGGVDSLRALTGDVRAIEAEDDAFDVVTILEVLEHLPDPERAAAEVLRVARRFVVASVPSKPDDNPGHIQLFDKTRLSALFAEAGAARVNVQFVLNHMIAVVRVS